MDFKTLVNKESFKAILLHHLKSQVKTKFGHTVTDKIQTCLEKGDSVSLDNITSSVSKDILESQDFPEFVTSFLGSVNDLLEDRDKYIPKRDKPGNSSQCSSASSVNASSIDFLSPNQFQDITHSLTSGTNAEKLEALGTLYRLPTLEHLTHHFLWTDVENGLHTALSSSVPFLKDQGLRLYIKMLTCPEPKVVQEGYLSLIKFFLQTLLPSLHQNGTDSNCMDKRQCAVEIISVLNKFFQNISTHWLRYPQSMIENITVQSLSILSPGCRSNSVFSVWMCFALCDPEAKWLKSLLHGHISRASLLNALQDNLDILYFAVGLCDNFCSEDKYLHLKGNCCKKTDVITEITHAICFLSHLLQYCDGREIFNSMLDGKIASCWTNVLSIVMNCTYKLCNISCFNCCSIACDVVSKKWLYIWCNDDTHDSNNHLIPMLITCLDREGYACTNMVYFVMRCFCEMLDGYNNAAHSFESQSSVNGFVIKLLTHCIELSVNTDLTEVCSSVLHIHNCSLVFMKTVFLTPSTLFLNSDFMKVLSKWLLKVKEMSDTKSIISNPDLFTKNEAKVVVQIEQNILDVSVCLLRKPIGSSLCHDISVYETNLNILLEKILKDVKSRNSVCPCDVFVLSSSLNRAITAKFVLTKTTVFRLSSIIWQLREENNDIENLQSLKFVLETLMPSIFCDLLLTEMIEKVILSSEISLFEHVLLFPNFASEYSGHEEYIILALQIISLLSTSIQSLCVLQSEFSLGELLLECQSQHLKIADTEMVDPVSVLQNHILVKSYVLGGPSERTLPSEMLEHNSDSYDWPFVKEFPVPEIFCHTIKPTDEDVNVFVDELHGADLKSAFLGYIQSKEKLSSNLVHQLLKNSLNELDSESACPKTWNFVELESANSVLHDTELVGLHLVQRYGENLGLIFNNDDGKLEQLLKASKCLIGSGESNRMDIFVCSVYLMCKGDIETAWLVIQKFSKCKDAIFIWREFLICVSDSCLNDISPPSVMFELCDLIVKQTLPQLYSALQFHGVLPSTIFNYWTVQCYWNYLDFEEISHFVLLNALFSGEFSLYFFVAILKHLHNFILQNAHTSDLFRMLLQNPICGFRVCNYVDFMNELSDMFHDTVTKYLLNILKDQDLL